jgi:hypothetical protein
MNQTETELGLGFPLCEPGFNQNQNDSGPLKYEARGEWHTHRKRWPNSLPSTGATRRATGIGPMDTELPIRREASYGGTIMSSARKMSALGLSWGSDVNWALACLAIGVLFTLAWAVVPA